MTENHTISYKLCRPSDWIHDIGNKIPAKIEDNQLVLSPSFGKGIIKYVELQKDLWVFKFDFTIHDGIISSQIPGDLNDFYVMSFYLSKSEIQMEYKENKVDLSIENINITFVSSLSELKNTLHGKKNYILLVIGFTQEWLIKNVLLDKYEILEKHLLPNEGVYLCESLDFTTKHLLDEILKEEVNQLTTLTKVLSILDYFFNRIYKRVSNNRSFASIHPSDFEKLIQARSTMDSHLNKTISVEKLATDAGMSISKFNRLFKQVFGTTPYSYHRKNRMEKAMELLVDEGTSVSETAYIIGYSNISQFSKSFKEEFNMLPSEVKKQF